jgi:hypothetical protein
MPATHRARANIMLGRLLAAVALAALLLTAAPVLPAVAQNVPAPPSTGGPNPTSQDFPGGGRSTGGQATPTQTSRGGGGTTAVVVVVAIVLVAGVATVTIRRRRRADDTLAGTGS